MIGDEGRRGTRRRYVRAAAVAIPIASLILSLFAWLGWRAWFRDVRAPGASGLAWGAIAAGERPFDGGERAAYRITWRVGSAEAVTAGSAALEASGGTDGCHFSLDVATTGWAAAVYDLRGRIESWTGTDLLPSRQEYFVRQGRRVTERTSRFDWSSRTVTAGDGEPRPVPLGARDGLSAWFHARTLPLTAGYRVRLPVVEAGDAYDVEIRVERAERIRVGGRDVEALRLALVVVRAADRDEVARAAAWVSDDARRLPLAVDLDTSLGSFRLELDAYRRR